MKINKKILKRYIDSSGRTAASIICMEECSELIQAISKELRGQPDKQHLAEEMGDVLICVEMLKQMYGIDETYLQTWIEFKQKRMAKRCRLMAENEVGLDEIS